MLTAQRYWSLLGWGMVGVAAIGAIAPLSLSGTVPLLGLLAFLGYRPALGHWPKIDIPFSLWITALCVLIFSSTLWSVSPEDSFSRASKVAPILIFTLPLLWIARECPVSALQPLRSLFPWIVVVMAGGILAEFLLDLPISTWLRDGKRPGGFSGLNKHLGVLMLFLPLALLLAVQTKRFFLTAFLGVAAVALMFFTESQSAMLALLVIPLSAAVLLLLPGAALPLTFGFVAFLFIFMPFLAPIAFDTFAASLHVEGSIANAASASARLENWDFISRKILTSPETGFGIDATRYITDFVTEQKYFRFATILHPHNMALQLWIEFGMLGVAVGLAGLGLLYRRLHQMALRTHKILAYVLFCDAMVFLMLSWSLWASWLLGLLLVVSVLLILATRTNNVPATS
jgi:O-antigen ligase